jgi:hypothetical protein
LSKPDEPDPWSATRAEAVDLAAFLRDLSATGRHVFTDHERERLRAGAAWIARSIGRPDLATTEAEKGGST